MCSMCAEAKVDGKRVVRRWRHVEDSCGGASSFFRISDTRKDRQAEVRVTSLLWVDTTHHLSAIFDGLLAVKSAGFSCETLADHLCLLEDSWRRDLGGHGANKSYHDNFAR